MRIEYDHTIEAIRVSSVAESRDRIRTRARADCVQDLKSALSRPADQPWAGPGADCCCKT